MAPTTLDSWLSGRPVPPDQEGAFAAWALERVLRGCFLSFLRMLLLADA